MRLTYVLLHVKICILFITEATLWSFSPHLSQSLNKKPERFCLWSEPIGWSVLFLFLPHMVSSSCSFSPNNPVCCHDFFLKPSAFSYCYLPSNLTFSIFFIFPFRHGEDMIVTPFAQVSPTWTQHIFQQRKANNISKIML